MKGLGEGKEQALEGAKNVFCLHFYCDLALKITALSHDFLKMPLKC